MAENRINIKQVAERAGVSVSTVSLVLNAKGRISETTREKVKKAAKSLGFILDRRAAQLRSGRSNLLGLVVNDISNPFFAEMAAAMEVAAFGHGYLTIIANSNDDRDRQAQLLEAMVGLGVEGIIVSPAVGSTPEDLAVLRTHALPYVVAVRDIMDMDAVFIGGEDHQSGLLATRHLLGLGHKNIAFVGGLRELSSFQRRYAGYREALKSQGLSAREELTKLGMPTRIFGAEVGTDLLRDHPEVTAMFCYNDVVANGVCTAVRAADKTIGQDISIVSIDNLPESEAAVPPLTTVELYPRAIGRRATTTIVTALAKGKHSVERVFLAPELIIRKSSGPAPGCKS